MMKVTVEIITGTYIVKEVSENATVRNLKEKIAAELSLPAKRLILLVGENERRRIVMDYEEEIPLLDLGVSDGSHLYLFFKHLDLVSCQEHAAMEEEGVLAETQSRRERGEGEGDDMEVDKDEGVKREEEDEDDDETEGKEKGGEAGNEVEVGEDEARGNGDSEKETEAKDGEEEEVDDNNE